MLNKKAIGSKTEPVTMVVEAGHIKRFAEAIGDLNPLYLDERAAEESSFGAIVAPPTFAQPLLAETNAKARKFLDFDAKNLLHGEQNYVFHKPMLAGDKITCVTRIADIYEKEGSSGTMDFFVVETEATDEGGEKVFTARSTLVVRRR